MSYISKALAALFGAVVSILAIFGIGNGETVLGIDQDAFMAIAVPVVTFIFTYFAPKNTPA